MKSELAAQHLQQGIALYLHVPFCQTKCSYCDFNTYTGLNGLIPSFVDALVKEIETWGRIIGQVPARTVFFGGGTPSLLSSEQMARIISTIRATFPLQPGAEVTAEANPEDITAPLLEGFLAAGVNRLSMGVQTLDRGLLKILGRRHTVDKAVEALHTARQAGFTNVNLDLMYGLPHQTLELWQTTLNGVLALRPEHVSAYCLTLEEGTSLQRWVHAGRLPDPDADLAADMYTWAEEQFAHAGYRQYEISNWSLPGRQSRHNLVYWRNQPYLGVGPGAHSYLGGYRFSTILLPHEYLARMAQPSQSLVHGMLDEQTIRAVPTIANVERIDTSLEMAETAMLALRLDEGLNTDTFRQRFNADLLALFAKPVQEMIAAGLLETRYISKNEEVVTLTPRGRLLGNEVFQRIITQRPGISERHVSG
ncbi:MAG: radical SAM family heme chaperone HemW [Dehalococcoidia bacterium]|nr:radical SAM family heme chaperone HemW [Dehalococcoidia bacterium]